MYIARILYPVKVLGPGDRIGIWFDGCRHACKGCSNPELWEFQKEYEADLKTVLELIHSVSSRHRIDGFTLTGGDPFLQPEALKKLLPELGKISKDILCYTGYEYEDIKDKYPDILEQLAVLIDGEYVEERNDGAILRGSSNQNIIILNEQLRAKYEEYLGTATNEIQNFKTRDTIISVGIHNRDYDEKLKQIAKEKGLMEVI